MILLALALLLTLVYIFKQKIFIYTLMVFFVLFDMLDGFYEDQQIFAAIRYLVPLALVILMTLKNSLLKKQDFILIILLLYLVILLPYSNGDISISTRNLFAITLTLMMIPVGRHLGQQVNFLKAFKPFNSFLLVALPVYIIIANVFNFGESYSDSFTTGFLVTSRMYIVPIVVFLALHYLIYGKEKKLMMKGIDIALILLNIGIMIINTRRTALGMLALAIIIYAILNRKIIFRMVILLLFFFSGLILSYPLYEDTLNAQLEKRERIKSLETYDEEGRYLEAFYIMDYHSRRQKITELLFGVQLFDTSDFGTKYFGRNRPIHSDLNMIFYSTGIVGFMLFGILFYLYFTKGIGKIPHSNRMIYFPALIMFLIVLLPGRFIGTMTYAPMLMLLLSATKVGIPENDVTLQHEDDAAVLD